MANRNQPLDMECKEFRQSKEMFKGRGSRFKEQGSRGKVEGKRGERGEPLIDNYPIINVFYVIGRIGLVWFLPSPAITLRKFL